MVRAWCGIFWTFPEILCGEEARQNHYGRGSYRLAKDSQKILDGSCYLSVASRWLLRNLGAFHMVTANS